MATAVEASGGRALPLRACLETRLDEIEEAAIARVKAIADPAEVSDPAYVEGLRAAVVGALDYALEVIETSGEQTPPVPVSLLAQARLAARNRIGIDTVLRRYFAGYSLFSDFFVQAAAELDLSDAALKHLLNTQARAFDRLLAAVSEEHAREERPSPSAEHRRLRLVQRLLAAEPIDATELCYPFDAWQLGLVCFGPDAERIVRELAVGLDRSLLLVRPEPHTVWAWLGGARRPDSVELISRAYARAPAGTWIAIGEGAEGLAGWRLTHRQAATALPIAMRSEDCITRYIDVAVLASASRDDLLSASLKRFYLEPLERGRDGGESARRTLRAYFDADCNVSSAAARLGVSRNTITSRLRAAETAIGRPLSSCAVELDIALCLEEVAV